MKKLMLFLMLLTSHNLKPGWGGIFWNSNCTLKDLSPYASQWAPSKDEYDALGEEANLFKALFYTWRCQWCGDIVNAQAYKDQKSNLKQCASGDDGYVCACVCCTGATACCCLYGCVHCPEVGVPAALVMGGAWGVHKVREKCFAKYGLKKDK